MNPDIERSVDAGYLVSAYTGGEEVLRIEQNGRIFWKGREVEGDDDFRAAMRDLAYCLKANFNWSRA